MAPVLHLFVSGSMRKGFAIMCALILAAAASGTTRPRPNWRAYRHRVISKRTAGSVAGRAAWGQMRNSPHEWGQAAGGFAKRAASGFAQHAVKTGIEMGVAGLHHENLHYQRSNLHGTLPRMKYAVKRTFIVPKTNRRGKTVALGRVSGAMGAGLISRAWQPASAAGIGAGVASGGIALGADVGMNMAREFWPRKHGKGRVAHHRRAARQPRAS